MNPSHWSWLPNGLTVARFFAGLALPWVPSAWQFPVLLVAGFTDLIDGELGRRLGGVSDFGRIMDPIADKTLVLAAVLVTWWSQWVTGPELVVFAARDIAVVMLSVMAVSLHRRHWQNLQPRLSGKIATGGQVLVLLLLFAYRKPLPGWVAVASMLSVISAMDYTVGAIQTWRRTRSSVTARSASDGRIS